MNIQYFLRKFLLMACLGLPACGQQQKSPSLDVSSLQSVETMPLGNSEKQPANGPTEGKEEKNDNSSETKAQTRRLITNTQEKITREQANLARREQLRDNLRTRRDSTREELAQASKTQMSGTNGNTRRTKEELMKLLAQQEEEIKTIEAEIVASQKTIDELELALDELTLKL